MSKVASLTLSLTPRVSWKGVPLTGHHESVYNFILRASHFFPTKYKVILEVQIEYKCKFGLNFERRKSD